MNIFKKALSTLTASALLMSATISGVGALGTADAAGSQSAIDLVNDMGLGWNLGNTFDCWGVKSWASQTETGWGNSVPSEDTIKAIQATGFDSVRIPVTWYENTDSSTFDIDDAYLARVKKTVDYCIDNGMYAIINMHWDWESGGSLWLNKGEAALPQYKAMWTEIANYFKDYDEHLVFESMNEVTFDYSVLNNFNQSFVDLVRATGGNNSSRLLLLAGSNTDMTKTMNSSFVVPDDDMVAVSIHYYNPPTFCVANQSSTWGYSSTWGSDTEINTVYNDFAKMKSYFVDKGVPVIIGEYGVLTNGGKDSSSILKFLETVAKTGLSTDGISTFLWDSGNCGDMQFFDRNNGKWFDSSVESIYRTLSNSTDVYTVDWVDAEYEQVEDKNGDLVDGAWRIYTTSAAKFRFELTGSPNSTGGTGGVSYWDTNANDGAGGWVNNGCSFRFSIDKDGNPSIYQTETDPSDSTQMIDVNAGYIILPDGVSTESVQVQIYYAGYADEAGDWHTLDAADYPVMVSAQVPGLVNADETTTTTVTTTTTTTEETTTTTTTTTEPAQTSTETETAPSESATGVGGYAYGDANCDGSVNMGDAVAIMRSQADPDNFALTPEGKAVADVFGNGDGVTNNDALAIQKFEAGIYTSLPC
ncbi:MAG: cellulase family glycosylhydrolase [Ruminococcus sp.]|nr:cellulase family glycosylhydrolase [Ruminococcus sp.]